MMTLKELLEQHPEWADLPVAVANSVGDLHYVDCSATVFVGEDGAEDVVESVLVFSAD